MNLQTTMREAIVNNYKEVFGDDYQLAAPMSRYT